MSDITKNTLFNKYKEKVAEVGDGKQYLVHWISFWGEWHSLFQEVPRIKIRSQVSTCVL